MSSVQLSLSSVGAATGGVPQRARRGVCRSLFGPVDHDELNRDIEAKLREISERDQKRWNFNFTAGIPLLGDYEWEGTAVDATPTFYQEAVQVGKKRALSLNHNPHTEAPNQENHVGDESAVGGRVSSDATVTGKPSCTRGKTSSLFSTATPSRITDFYVKRRKRGDLKRREGVSQPPFSALNSEQTPRKRLR